MIVGIIGIELYMYEVNSLKEKRHVVKSIVDRLKNKFNISISEVDFLDIWNKTYLGISIVSNDNKIVDGTISKIIDFIDSESRVELINTEIEIL